MSTDVPEKADVEIGDYQYGFHDPTDNYEFKSRKGLDAEIVAQISEMKKEPEWMRQFRLDSLKIFESRPMPDWGGDMSELDFDDIYYYMKAAKEQGRNCVRAVAL